MCAVKVVGLIRHAWWAYVSFGYRTLGGRRVLTDAETWLCLVLGESVGRQMTRPGKLVCSKVGTKQRWHFSGSSVRIDSLLVYVEGHAGVSCRLVSSHASPSQLNAAVSEKGTPEQPPPMVGCAHHVLFPGPPT